MGRRSRQRKQRPPKGEPPKQPRSKLPTQETKGLWHRVLESSGRLSTIVGTVAALIAIFLAVRDALREPEIRAAEGYIDNPFDSRFSLHNPSLLFRMSDMRFTCEVPEARFEGGSLSQIDFRQAELLASVDHGHAIAYRCPFKTFFGDRSIDAVWVRITVDFKTIGISRKSVSEDFTWTSRTKRWTEGTVIN
jgi:hypothetical protein